MQYLIMLLALSTSTSNLLYTILFTLFFLITMRKVEMQMNTAIRNRVNWSGGNTTVMINENNNKAKVFLHGNLIAEVCNEFVAIFDGGWQTVTTKSRLNALLAEFRPQVRVFQKDFVWFIRHGKNNFVFQTGSLV